MKPWMKNVRQVEPYVPGEQPKALNVTKLNTNENPYPPAPGVAEKLTQIQANHLRRYPDPNCEVLVRALAEYYQVPKERMFVGVGSDDVLAMAFMTFFNSEKPILFPDISYAFYEVWADMFRIPFEKQLLDAEFRLVKEDYYKENGGVIFPNPNAPTSLYVPLEAVEEIVRANPSSVVIVDEAYIDFGGESAMKLTEKYDNLLVVQTFSKSRSLAGMRIGFAIGHEDLIQALNSVKFSFNSYTMNETALLLGAEAVRDEAYFQNTIQKIIAARNEAEERLHSLGFTFPKPMGNFIFATHKTLPAAELFQALREADIYVRYFNKPRIDNYLRITVGTPEQMEVLYRFVEDYQAAR